MTIYRSNTFGSGPNRPQSLLILISAVRTNGFINSNAETTRNVHVITARHFYFRRPPVESFSIPKVALKIVRVGVPTRQNWPGRKASMGRSVGCCGPAALHTHTHTHLCNEFTKSVSMLGHAQTQRSEAGPYDYGPLFHVGIGWHNSHFRYWTYYFRCISY